MKIIMSLLFVCFLLAFTEAKARTIICTGGGQGVVAEIEDYSHIQGDEYLSFYVEGECRRTKYTIKRGAFSEASLKEVKKIILISYTAKKALRFKAIDIRSAELDLNLPISLL